MAGIMVFCGSWAGEVLGPTCWPKAPGGTAPGCSGWVPTAASRSPRPDRRTIERKLGTCRPKTLTGVASVWVEVVQVPSHGIQHRSILGETDGALGPRFVWGSWGGGGRGSRRRPARVRHPVSSQKCRRPSGARSEPFSSLMCFSCTPNRQGKPR